MRGQYHIVILRYHDTVAVPVTFLPLRGGVEWGGGGEP